MSRAKNICKKIFLSRKWEKKSQINKIKVDCIPSHMILYLNRNILSVQLFGYTAFNWESYCNAKLFSIIKLT